MAALFDPSIDELEDVAAQALVRLPTCKRSKPMERKRSRPSPAQGVHKRQSISPMNRVLSSPVPKRERARRVPSSSKRKTTVVSRKRHSPVQLKRQPNLQIQRQSGMTPDHPQQQVVQQPVYGAQNVNQGYGNSASMYPGGYAQVSSENTQQQWIAYPQYGSVKCSPAAANPPQQTYLSLHPMQHQLHQQMQQQQQQHRQQHHQQQQHQHQQPQYQLQHPQQLRYAVQGGMQVPVQVHVNQAAAHQYQMMPQVGAVHQQQHMIQVPQNMMPHNVVQPIRYAHG